MAKFLQKKFLETRFSIKITCKVMVHQKKFFEALRSRLVVIKGSSERAFYDNKSNFKSFKIFFLVNHDFTSDFYEKTSF